MTWCGSRRTWTPNKINSFNTDTISRLGQIKQYLNNITGSLEENDQPKAIMTLSRFKKTILKEDFLQLPNQMILEGHRAKVDKLRAEVQ